jgi:hypothetical protein
VQHFIYKCQQWTEERELYLRPYITEGLDKLLKTKEGTLGAARFLVATKRIEQFKAVAPEALS